MLADRETKSISSTYRSNCDGQNYWICHSTDVCR